MKTLVTLSMLVGLTIAGTIPAVAQQIPEIVELQVFVTDSDTTVQGTIQNENMSIDLNNRVDRSLSPPHQSHTLDLCVEPIDGRCPDF